jgi:hypothetical protein
MSDMKWTDTQSSEQKSQASKTLAKVKDDEKDKLAKGLIMFPVPIKYGAAIKWLTPYEAQEKINEGADVSTGIKIIVKKMIKSLEVSENNVI